MKHLQSIHFGQQVQKYELSKELIETINNRMNANIEEQSFVVAKYNYISNNSDTAKVPRMDSVSTCKQEFRITDWITEVDLNQEIQKCVTDAYNRCTVDDSFELQDITIHDCWITDQKQNEFQVVHKHSGYSQIGLSAVLYLEVPDFGEENAETEIPHNGRLTMIGNGAGLFTTKTYLIEPKVGDFYIFPYDVEHCVYPFKGEGNRRSMSINFDVNLVKKGFKKIQKENYYLREV